MGIWIQQHLDVLVFLLNKGTRPVSVQYPIGQDIFREGVGVDHGGREDVFGTRRSPAGSIDVSRVVSGTLGLEEARTTRPLADVCMCLNATSLKGACGSAWNPRGDDYGC